VYKAQGFNLGTATPKRRALKRRVSCISLLAGVFSLVPIAIELPSLLSQTEFNLSRWAEILADRDIAKLPYRVETDRHLMTPPAGIGQSAVGDHPFKRRSILRRPAALCRL
jgi:hypothetical protein